MLYSCYLTVRIVWFNTSNNQQEFNKKDVTSHVTTSNLYQGLNQYKAGQFCGVITLTNVDTDKDLVSCVGWTTADELYSSGSVRIGYTFITQLTV